jgi:AAA15 family ATPase/GTPase
MACGKQTLSVITNNKMIKINNFEIINYRSCIRTKVDISSNLTTLIGANGVGKSNILNSLQLLKKTRRNRYHQIQPEILDSLSQSTVTINVNIDNETYALKAQLFYEIDDKNIEDIYSSKIQIKHLSNSEKKTNKWIDIEVDLFEYVERARHMNRPLHQLKLFKNNQIENDALISIVEYLSGISYYGATQFSDPTKCPISIELEDSRLMRTSRSVKTHDKFIQDLYLSFKHDNSSFLQYLNTVDKNGIGLVDKINFFEHEMPISSYIVKSGGKITHIERNKTIIIPTIKIDNFDLTPNQLSEGTFKTLALVFYILSDKSELLLIEEPEVCIHHGLLSSIIELIKIQSKKKQIIISTHSDFVLDKLTPESVILVKKSPDKGTLAIPLTKHLSKNDYSALKDYLANSGNLGEYWKEGGFENE